MTDSEVFGFAFEEFDEPDTFGSIEDLIESEVRSAIENEEDRANASNLADIYEEMDHNDEAECDKRRTVQVFKTMSTAKKMKLLSEAALDDALDWHLEEGCAYHCVSFGDVDSLTYLRHILRQQPIEYLMLSTWCMAMEDAVEIAEWVRRGMIGHIDFYVGEIFKNGYRGVRDAIEAIARSCGGRVARFRNHSKVMAGFGRDFAFAIESSANVNTNPRTEQTVITVDRGLAEFYKEFYDKINSFDPGFEDWKPYEIAGGRDESS